MGAPRGRPVNSRNRLTNELLAVTHRDGITPLEVMLENMRFYHGEARKLLGQVYSMVKNGLIGPELVEALQTLERWRERAEESAARAAPYVHPRLNAVDFHNAPGTGADAAMIGSRDAIDGKLAALLARRGDSGVPRRLN